MTLSNKALHCAVGFALSVLGTAHAEVMLSEYTSTKLTAMILPDSAEIGSTANIYMGAKLGEKWYLRNGTSMQNWQPLGEPIPAALENVTLTADPLIVTVVDFDIANLIQAGLEVYVAYGKTPAGIFAMGHMGKVLSKDQGGFSNTPNPNPNTTPAGSNTSTSACDNAAAPEGISYTQTGNLITVTTNGKCIVPPESMCNTPAPTTATNISMLQSFAMSEFKMSGITMNIPGIPNPLEQAGKALTGSKTCLINVPENYSAFTVNADVCFDITNKVSGSLQSIPSMIATVNPPITETFKGTITNTQVNDCFTSGADTITNVLTKEIWIKQADGSYLKK